MKKIIVKKKSVYGNEYYYPACGNSFMFAAITETKTLSIKTINILKMNGYEIEVQKEQNPFA